MNPQPTLIEEDQGSARDLALTVSSPIVDGDLPDLDALEAVARNADDGNSWQSVSDGFGDHYLETGIDIEGGIEAHDIAGWNADVVAHIAAFDPPTALKLIATLRAQAAEIERLKSHLADEEAGGADVIAALEQSTARVEALEGVCKLAEQNLHRAYCATRNMEDADAFENARDRIRAALNPLPNPVESSQQVKP